MNRPAVMVRRDTEIVEVNENNLASGSGHIAVRGEPANSIVNRRHVRCVIEIDELVRAEVRIEGHAKKPAFAARVDRKGHERSGEERAIFDDAQLAALKAD